MNFSKVNLDPPRTIREAEAKRVEIRNDLESIGSQLESRKEPKPGEDAADYEKWRDQALKAHDIKQKQLNLLGEWVKLHRTKVENTSPELLVYEAFRVFRDLENRGIEFNVDQRSLVNVLECYLRERASLIS